jgi:hypothetical protein
MGIGDLGIDVSGGSEVSVMGKKPDPALNTDPGKRPKLRASVIFSSFRVRPAD